jgi:hypothetical protein
MVGNDVVDLGDAESRSEAHHPRFDARVFAGPELRALDACADSERLRWILWAAKESAYKAARRVDATTVFSPRLFVAWLQPEEGAQAWSGHVEHGDDRFRVRVALENGCAHAVATHPQARTGVVKAGVGRVARGVSAGVPGRAARDLALAGIARLLGVSRGELRIERRGRIPRVRRVGGSAPLLSLSHHGRFVAYACLAGGEGLRP